MQLTEDYIARCLHEAKQTPSTDGYAEIPQPFDAESLKCAAVLIPLVSHDDEWHLLFTRRTDAVESHKGQVSFPGGACDDEEQTAEQTALREAEEEIGVRPRDVRVLGRLNPMVTITHFRVTPVVGVIPWPYAFRVASIEVARIFTIPLTWLADASNRWELFRPDTGQPIVAYHPYDGELLWGATARMTADFLRILGF